MIKIGTDAVEISRFSKMENFERFLKHVFNREEIEYFKRNGEISYESVAGAFAAKEAFSKYMGSGFRGFGLRDISVLHDSLGKPYITFMNNKITADLSISHTDNIAIAVVCGEDTIIGGKMADLFKSYRAMLPERTPEMHKGMCGNVLVVAGSVGMVGAARLCARSALRSGSGLVTLGTPRAVSGTAAAKLDEIMTLPLSDIDGVISSNAVSDLMAALEKCDVVAFGPGLGKGDGVLTVLEEILKSKKTCIIDADGLNAISKDCDILNKRNCDVIITPHLGEMSRLTRLSVDEISENREKVATEFAKKYKITVLLKGHNTVIASQNGEIHINQTGNSGMASGGMGDVLCGMVASFAGQGVSPYKSAVLAAFLHGLAGDIAAEEIGEFGMIAGDVEKRIPLAIKRLQGLF